MATALRPAEIIHRGGYTVDPEIPERVISRPSEGGPLTINGHTPGCVNAQRSVQPSLCECQGKEAEG